MPKCLPLASTTLRQNSFLFLMMHTCQKHKNSCFVVTTGLVCKAAIVVLVVVVILVVVVVVVVVVVMVVVVIVVLWWW